MRDCMDLGCAPSMEHCAQVGTDEYFDRARTECRAYIALLRRSLGDEPPGATLSVKSNPHDFGTYLSVVCYFDPDDPAATDYAFKCEAKGPREWDEQARRELNLKPESESDSERS